jgi:RNA polymerase sigma-70 factor (ECF subfamily)
METPVGQIKPHKYDDASLCEAIRLAQQGNLAGFEIIYQLYAGRVYAFCLGMSRDPIEAENLAREAFLLLFRELNTFHVESAFCAWLHRLTLNLVLMRLRQKWLRSRKNI